PSRCGSCSTWRAGALASTARGTPISRPRSSGDQGPQSSPRCSVRERVAWIVLTRQNLLQRLAIVAALLAAATVALVQQPLVVPHYYAFQLAELQPGAEVAGELTESDGQNFKDGSRVDLYVLGAVAGELES